jgi:hypothetical protein
MVEGIGFSDMLSLFRIAQRRILESMGLDALRVQIMKHV